MKKLILIAALMFTFGQAQAEESKPKSQVHVNLVSLDTTRLGADLVLLQPNDYPKGVFVQVKEMFGERPISTAIFAEKLHAHGYKIALNKEDADVTILVGSSTINFKDIERGADSISASQIDSAVGIVGTAVLTGGFSLLWTDYSAFNNTKAVYTDLSVAVVFDDKSGVKKYTLMTAGIKTDASSNQVTRVFFETMSEEWLKVHLRKVDAAQSVSAVATTPSLADATPASAAGGATGAAVGQAVK